MIGYLNSNGADVVRVLLLALAVVAAGMAAACATTNPAGTTAPRTLNASPTPTAAATPSANTTTAPTAAPTTTAERTIAPTPAATPEATPPWISFPGVSCCRGRDVEAGLYRLPGYLDLDLTLDLPTGWRVLNEQRARLFMLGRGENELGNPSEITLIANATAVDGTAQAAIDAISGAEELTQIGDTTEANLAGFTGLQVNLRAKPNPAYEGDPEADIPAGVQPISEVERYFEPGFRWTTATPDARLRLMAFEVGDQVMLVYLEAPPTAFDALASDATEMLDSLDPVTP